MKHFYTYGTPEAGFENLKLEIAQLFEAVLQEHESGWWGIYAKGSTPLVERRAAALNFMTTGEESVMKRDMELIRKILFVVEEGSSSNVIDGFDINSIKYHQELLVEAGLVNGTVVRYKENATEIPNEVFIQRITWQGHEFLDSVRQDTIWNAIKSEFKDSSVETIVKVAKQLAEGFAKKKVEQLLG